MAGEGSQRALGVLAGAAALVVVVALPVLGLAMRRDYNHDEHQFIAGAALIAREGLLPYRDFAWFHVPTLAYLYAALFRLSDSLLLAARLLNVAAAVGMTALLLGVSLTRLRAWRPGVRLAAGALIVILLIATPAFQHAGGRAWNHDLPVLLALAAFVVQVRALEGGERVALAGSAAAGVLIGLAAGMRLSYAPLALPCLLAPLIWRRASLHVALACAGGLALGFLPALLLFVRAPEAFFFGNLRYAALNTAWYHAQAGAEAASLARKFADVARFLMHPGNALLVGVTGLALLRVRGWRRARDLHLWLLLWPFLIGGALAPTPVQMQYVYLFFPFLALGTLSALTYDSRPRWTLGALGLVTLSAAILAAPRYAEAMQIVVDPGEWFPIKAHVRGVLLEQLVESGPGGLVFTLAPALPLEGKATIDPRTATGPFAWRIAPLLSTEERTRFGVLGADAFADAMGAQPPRALLTGLHGDDAEAEAVQVEWAAAQGFIPVAMPEAGTLWLSRSAVWGEQLALAAHTFPAGVLSPGDSFVATLYLQSTAPFQQNLNILVRAVDRTGRELFREEGWPYGSPTSTWEVGAVWPHGVEVHTPHDAQAGLYRIEVSFYAPETLEMVGEAQAVAWVQVASSQEAPLAPPSPVRFADGVLLAVTDEGEVLDGTGEVLSLPIAWGAAARPARDYTLFAHLVDGAGTLVAQADRPPLDGFYPTSRWLPGRWTEDRIDLPLPPESAPGLYTLRLGLYDAETGHRLPILSGGDFVEAARVCIPAGSGSNGCS